MASKIPFLSDLKVVELAGVLAGPAVGLFFAELGATVFKVENPEIGGDITRAWRISSEQPDQQSAYYSSVNWGKTAVWANLENDGDRQRVLALIADADIVLSNFKPSSAKRLGMEYDSLKELNPRLIYAQISGYGEHDETPAFDVVLQAETGFMAMNGQPDSPPTKMPVALIDILAAHQLKQGILVALWQREHTKKGAFIHVSLQDAALASLANQATNWLMAAHNPTRMGSLHPNIAPYGELFATRDAQQIVLAVGTDRQFQHLCRCLNRPDLGESPLFAHNTLRLGHRQKLADELSALFIQLNSTDILPKLKRNGVPAGIVRTMQQVQETPAAQRLHLKETTGNGQETIRMKTAIFEIN
ncbi:MAG: hypothetical protein RI894_1959 [Bacteroidota bacterium]|jgi:crotonobetainyl-CoA:carnitine CoA-transferase CaiB-like acyl-CoA transferase